MNVFKMLSVAIRNYKQNFKVCFLYGTLITLAVSLFGLIPSIMSFIGINSIALGLISVPFSLVSSVILPSVTMLPVFIALTKPSADGPYTFKERFSAKFLPFTILSILLLVIFGIAGSILALICSIYITINTLIGSEIGFTVALIVLTVILIAFSIITEIVMIYSYIALATENIKVSSAFSKGFKMFFDNFLRSVGHYIFFSIIIMLLPIALIVLSMIFAVHTRFLFLIFVILAIIFSAFVVPIFSSCMVELYRKNWLLSHNIPLKKEETEEEIFETPDDETIYL